MSNSPLNRAIREKNDEFYTLMPTIEKELQYYWNDLKGKNILLNCDNWETSNFYKYFKEHFNDIGINGLVALDYKTGNYAFVTNQGRDIVEDNTSIDGGVLSYDSDISNAFLFTCDVVITNPPFSKARDYLNHVMRYGKRFLLLYNLNTVCTHDIFPNFMTDNLWLGRTIHNGDVKFEVPMDYPTHSKTVEVRDGKKYLHVNTVRWITNIGTPWYPEPLHLTKHYTPEKYPKYDNLDAINCDVTKDIPVDYDGCIGVPITFLDKYNPSQFLIVGKEIDCGRRKVKINGHEKYNRIIIKHK